MSAEIQGTITQVADEPVGSVLEEAAPAGATVLRPANPDAFALDGGQLQIGEEVHSYSHNGETLQLDAPLEAAYDEDTPVYVYPLAVIRWAYLHEPGGEEELQARVPHALWDRLAPGIRQPHEAEEVEAILTGEGVAVLTDVLGREPRVDGRYIEAHSIKREAVTDGEPPSESPTPTVTGAIGALAVRWDAVSNHDPVTYEVHVSDSQGFTPSSSTLAAEVQGTLTFIRTLPAGGALQGDTTYYVRLIARDADGAAAPSDEASGEIVMLNTGDIPSDGKVPPQVGTPSVTPGPGFLFVEWEPVENADPVAYEVHMDSHPLYTPGPSTLYARTPATSIVINKEPNGSDLDLEELYVVSIVATDPDGAALESGKSIGVAPAAQITETLIEDDAISTPKLQANAVIAGKIATNAVTADKINANAVTANKIATNAVTAGKIAANAVTAGKIAANAVTADKLLANEALFELLQTVLLISNKIAVPGTSGQRLELDQDGLRLFSSDGEPVVDLDTTTGSALISGDFAPEFETPSIRQSASAKSTGSASSISPTFGGPSISGNALIAVIIGFNGFSAAAPSGWRIVGEIEDGNGAILRIYERLEASSVSQATFATNNAFCLAHMFELDGVAPGSLDVVDVKRETDFFSDGITSPSIGPGFPPTQPGFTLATFAAFRAAGSSDPAISSPSSPFTLARSTGWSGAEANLRLATFGAVSGTEPQECGVTTTGSSSVLMGLITVKAKTTTEPDRPRLITRPDPPAFGASIASAASFVPIPRPSCKVYRATRQSIPSGTPTAVAMSAPQWDTAGMFASSAPTRITIPRAGTYLLDAYGRWEAVGGGQRLRMIIQRNGAQRLTGQDFSSSVAASEQSCATVARLSEGDYLELLVQQGTSSPVGINDATLSATWIGD